MEWGQLEGGRFAHVWNIIVKTFREEDLISDRLCLLCAFKRITLLKIILSRYLRNVFQIVILFHCYMVFFALKWTYPMLSQLKYVIVLDVLC